ncbi:MAG: hypothetical protein RL250_118, partial [Verrucomicrobiota bacterium]
MSHKHGSSMSLPRPSFGCVLLAASLFAAPTGPAPVEKAYEPDFTPQPPVQALSPEEELKTI